MLETPVIVCETTQRRMAEFVRHALTRARIDADLGGQVRSIRPGKERASRWVVSVNAAEAEQARPIVEMAQRQLERVRGLSSPTSGAQRDSGHLGWLGSDNGGPDWGLEAGGDGGAGD